MAANMKIDLSKNAMEIHFHFLVDKLLSLPEVAGVKVKELEICRENKKEMIPRAVEESYHDSYSDIDLCVVVKLSADSGISPEDYHRHIEHWGFPLDMILGMCFVPENRLYRIAGKNGMRYDLKFAFVFPEDAPIIHLEPIKKQQSNVHWPMENIYRFWFVQIQALGKLYRDDFLIGSHLANLSLNETCVQQMVLRDLKYNTNHHRYGYKEKLTYRKYMGKCPYQMGNSTFDDIADRIYAAALAYDALVSCFYEECEPRSKDFFAIWDAYEEQRKFGEIDVHHL